MRVKMQLVDNVAAASVCCERLSATRLLPKSGIYSFCYYYYPYSIARGVALLR